MARYPREGFKENEIRQDDSYQKNELKMSSPSL